MLIRPIKRQSPFIAAYTFTPKQNASVNLHMTRVVLSTNWCGWSMLITANVDFVYISRRSSRREQNQIYLYALVNLKPK